MNDFGLWSDKEMKLVSIIKYPSGKFGFVGSVPSELSEIKTNKAYQEIEVSKVFETYTEADKAYKDYLLQKVT